MEKLKECPTCAMMHELGKYHDHRCCGVGDLQELKRINFKEYLKHISRPDGELKDGTKIYMKTKENY